MVTNTTRSFVGTRLTTLANEVVVCVEAASDGAALSDAGQEAERMRAMAVTTLERTHWTVRSL